MPARSQTSRINVWLKWFLITCAGAAAGVYALNDGHDFGVYYGTAQALFERGAPIYQDSYSWYPLHRDSVWGHIPGGYRYPPLLLFLVGPLTLLPPKAALFLWTAGKVFALFLVGAGITRVLGAHGRKPLWLAAAAFYAPYLVSEIRTGNAESYIGALCAAALLIVAAKPRLAGALLGLGAAIKLWPLFFLPYLWAAGLRRRVVAPCLLTAALLTALPALYFGPAEYAGLLTEWWSQESAIAQRLDEPWFRSVSIRGMLMRNLTDVEYQYPDPNYPHVNLVSISPQLIYWIGLAINVVLYAALLLWVRQTPEKFRWDTHGAAFCLLVLMQPNPHRQVPVVLLPAALAAASGMRGAYPRWGRACFAVAAAIPAVLPFVGSEINRFLVTAGADPIAILLATAALVSPLLERLRPKPAAPRTGAA